MGITYFNPASRLFKAYDPASQNTQLSSDVLLLNIFIEMRVQTELLEIMNRGLSVETAESLRTSIVSDI